MVISLSSSESTTDLGLPVCLRRIKNQAVNPMTIKARAAAPVPIPAFAPGVSVWFADSFFVVEVVGVVAGTLVFVLMLAGDVFAVFNPNLLADEVVVLIVVELKLALAA
jgi:hypothetical protein